ncbi:unnamed protein product [Ceratitis capitata]|uniref:(Mediterranean fruit fly) hypothetical protein n=1 Tax=Ceratitis capitata TaxID=7213 RepID=A0A811VDS8_CERCA|nr:unnamed protein product [Ceratitis capitata]
MIDLPTNVTVNNMTKAVPEQQTKKLKTDERILVAAATAPAPKKINSSSVSTTSVAGQTHAMRHATRRNTTSPLGNAKGLTATVVVVVVVVVVLVVAAVAVVVVVMAVPHANMSS